MSNRLSESEMEEFAIKQLERMGYEYIYAPNIAPDTVQIELLMMMCQRKANKCVS